MDPEDPRLKMRPIGGLVLLAGALVAVLLTFAAYGGLVWSGMRGRPAAGPEAVLRFEGCHEAIGPMVERLEDMGLTATVRPAERSFAFLVVLPSDPAVAASVPATLAKPGKVEITAGGTVLATNVDVTEAVPRLDLRMASYVVVRLSPAAADRVAAAQNADPGGALTLRVDGTEVATQRNSDPTARGELEFAPRTDDDAVRMRTIAEWAVLLDHGPLPCPVVPAASGDPDTP
jgi:hypothetical protein